MTERRSRRAVTMVLCLVLAATWAAIPAPAAAGGGHGGKGHGRGRPDVLPHLRRNLVAAYDFEHPVRGNPAQERDLGRSGTELDLVNGGAAMRVHDGAHRGSRFSLQTRQVNPTVAGNDDWKAGVWSDTGVSSLGAFNQARGTTIMGWFKMTGTNPNPNSTTPDPDDFFNAVGLAGVLSGDSDGHAVRALLELIDVSGTLRLVALGRRVDGSSSQTFAASEDWRTLLPPGRWVHLTATFDFDDGTMALYRNGRPLDGFYTLPGDPWGVVGEPEPDLTSATDPRGIKIGGSFPQNTAERNPCNCRFDSLMFLDRALTVKEVWKQYRQYRR
jgi:Concanavalin A-like lectin/glucanases superfamily